MLLKGKVDGQVHVRTIYRLQPHKGIDTEAFGIIVVSITEYRLEGIAVGVDSVPVLICSNGLAVGGDECAFGGKQQRGAECEYEGQYFWHGCSFANGIKCWS